MSFMDMQESIDIAESCVNTGHQTLNLLDHQLDQEIESFSLLADSKNDLHRASSALDGMGMSWARWAISVLNWRNNPKQYDLSPLSPLDEPPLTLRNKWRKRRKAC